MPVRSWESVPLSFKLEKLFDPSSGLSKSKDGPTYEELVKENKRLKKELSYVEEINDILKKKYGNFLQRQVSRFEVISFVREQSFQKIPIHFLCRHFE